MHIGIFIAVLNRYSGGCRFINRIIQVVEIVSVAGDFFPEAGSRL